MLKSVCLGLAVVLGVVAGANGLFMLTSPETWYFTVPGVTSSGPFNQHFVRDISLIFLMASAGFLVGAARPGLRSTLWAAATTWLTGHALFHLWQVAVGMGPVSDIQRDFPAVTLPALIGLGLTWWAVADPSRSGRRAAGGARVSSGPESVEASSSSATVSRTTT